MNTARHYCLTGCCMQYVSGCPLSGGGRRMVDVGEMALALQAQYSEYARRKRAAFKSLVTKGLSPLYMTVSLCGYGLCVCSVRLTGGGGRDGGQAPAD